MMRKILPAVLCLLLLAGCSPSAAPAPSPEPTASAQTESSPMTALLESLYDSYDPAQGAMETKRRCEELLNAWTVSGEDAESAQRAVTELLSRREIRPELLSDKLDTLREMAARLCAGDAKLVRDPAGRCALPDAESAARLFEAFSAALEPYGNS